MTSETKAIGIIGIITIIIIAGGLYIASKTGAANVNGGEPAVSIDPTKIVRPDSPQLVGADASATSTNPKKVQIVEFGDLECPACAELHPEMQKLLQTDGSNIDFVFRFIPIHPYSKEAAAAALAAGEQGKFFQMFDIIFDNQDAWTAYGVDYEKLFDTYAQQIGLNMDKYHADLTTNQAKYYALVDRDAADAASMNIDSTPTIVFNGSIVLRGAFPYAQLKQALTEAQNATSTASSNAVTATSSGIMSTSAAK